MGLVFKGCDMVAECDHGGCRTRVVLDLPAGDRIAAYVNTHHNASITGAQLCEGQAAALGWFTLPTEQRDAAMSRAWFCPAHPEVRRG